MGTWRTAEHNTGRDSGKRLLTPMAMEAEMAVIGALLHDGDALEKIRDTLKPEYFAGEYAPVYRAVADLDQEHIPVNMVSLQLALRKRGYGDSVANDQLLRAALHCVPHAGQIQYFAQCVTEQARLRSLIEIMDDAARDACLQTESASTLAEKLIQQARGLVDKDLTPQFRTYTSQELDAGDFALEYLIPGLLVKGQPCVLAGPKKCLKTNVLIDLTLSLASQTPFLNKFDVTKPARVAMISGESGKATIQETARRIARTKPEREFSKYDSALWSFDLPILGQPGTVRQITDYIHQHRVDVLILDPAYLAMPIGDGASNLFTVGAVLQDLVTVTNETGVTFVICHHTRKNLAEPFKAPELESIAWAGFQEWARQWMLLGRRTAYNPNSGGQHELWLTVGGSAGHSSEWGMDITEGVAQDQGGRIWDVEFLSTEEAEARQKQQVTVRKPERDIRHTQAYQNLLDAYRRFPEGESSTTLRHLAGISGSRFDEVNAWLRTHGLIEPCQLTKNKRVIKAYRLSDLGRSCVVDESADPVNDRDPDAQRDLDARSDFEPQSDLVDLESPVAANTRDFARVPDMDNL